MQKKKRRERKKGIKRHKGKKRSKIKKDAKEKKKIKAPPLQLRNQEAGHKYAGLTMLMLE